MNATISLGISKSYEISKGCFEWCREQNFIHENNLEIFDLTFVVIALISIIVNNLIYNYPEILMNLSGMKEDDLMTVHDATYFLAFIMLILHIVYVLWMSI